ncbi:MAG: TIGR04255 family protein [Gemmatimonas sp.]|nr:TIGR04255 family protein [Gemmatimonas sp.]
MKGPPPAEVPLRDAPLIRVLAQARFPLIASVQTRDFIGPFQEAIRRDYPILRPQQSRGVLLGVEGVVESRSSTVWRFQDSSDAWRVSLAPDFLAIETTRYTSRDDFLRRFELVLGALREHVDPQVIDRIGIRYIDRVAGDNLSDLPELVRPEIASVMATALAEDVRQAISENVFALPEDGGHLIARWGLVPPNGTVDPAAIDPISEASWLLDLDAYLEETQNFDPEELLAVTRRFAERIYTFFRWSVTDEFLRRYGGEL